MRVVAAVACAVMLLCLGVLPGHAEKRVALVVGNGDYRNTPRLANPRNDAEDVAAALRRTGFETIVGLDLDQAGMQDVAIRFARAARDADVAMFYYSGHAIQYAGMNYLLPVDAQLTDGADLRRLARVDDIVADLQQAKSLRILVLDSCRDNPLAEDLKRRSASVQRGLARLDSPQGMIVAYATQAGRTADDGTGRNSPYTAAFLKQIEAQEEIGTVFRRISADVYQATRQNQLPELSLSLIGEFYLHGRPGGPSAAPDAAAQAWAVTKNTTSQAVLEDFIRQFGATFYGSMARARLGELKQEAARSEPSAPPATNPSAKSTPGINLYNCLAPFEVQDRHGNIQRNLSALSSEDICIKQDVFVEGALHWVLHIIQNKVNEKAVFWMVPHDNGIDEFDSAVYGVKKYGGTVVAVETGENRHNGPQDPNRNFDAGTGLKCREQVAPSPVYTAHVMRWWWPGSPIVALDTNGSAGGFSMSKPPQGTFPFRTVASVGKLSDRTMVYVASRERPENNASLMQFVKQLNQKGINVLYELLSLAHNDCSLSNYAMLKGIRDYFNIEALDGPSQRRILDILLDALPNGGLGPVGKPAAVRAQPGSDSGGR